MCHPCHRAINLAVCSNLSTIAVNFDSFSESFQTGAGKFGRLSFRIIVAFSCQKKIKNKIPGV